LRITGVRIEEATVYVDFSSDNLHGGSLEEILLVEQVVTTLTGLPGLEKVQFLVDGERRDTLMGHISADEPLGREDL
jgi:spore germination protein GerM